MLKKTLVVGTFNWFDKLELVLLAVTTSTNCISSSRVPVTSESLNGVLRVCRHLTADAALTREQVQLGAFKRQKPFKNPHQNCTYDSKFTRLSSSKEISIWLKLQITD